MNGAPIVIEKRIEIRWADLDAFRHVNNAVYLTYLEEARDSWLEAMVPEGRSTWDYVLARVAIDFRRELREEDEYLDASCRLLRLGRSSIVTHEEVRTVDGELAAEAEVVMVARDAQTGRSRPLTPAEREAFGRVAES
ncbi:MAG TPA: thioesterase family protein [Solirubrobacteraceae bacterium]|nr:thioesterase family protein [Solirubrobacteraceae bacterium]